MQLWVCLFVCLLISTVYFLIPRGGATLSKIVNDTFLAGVLDREQTLHLF